MISSSPNHGRHLLSVLDQFDYVLSEHLQHIQRHIIRIEQVGLHGEFTCSFL